MQIYALNTSHQLLQVKDAKRGEIYTCPECLKKIGVRGGRLRQVHFFHLEKNSCRLGNKSRTHLQIQLALQKMLVPELILLEHHFPQINRIADVVWPSKKIVFEVQVSPITAQEVRSRNRDYKQAGFQVIWILHQGGFNRTQLKPAEIALRSSPHYFTNIDSFGRGYFYDQQATLMFKRRIKRTASLPVRFKKIIPIDKKSLSRSIPPERKEWEISVEGDLFHYPHLFALNEENRPAWYKKWLRPCRIVFLHFLEKTTY